MEAAVEIGGNPVRKHKIQPEYRDEQADDPSRDTKFSSANGDREIFIFPVQLTATSRIGNLTRLIVLLPYMDLPICSPWTFRENHSPNIIYTVNRRNQPTAMDLYFLDWVRTRYKTEPDTHTKSAHTVL